MQPDELSAEYTAAACRYYERCGLVAPGGCAEVYAWSVHPDVAAAVDAGILLWQYKVAEACIDLIDRLDCDLTSAVHREHACFGIYVGTKHDGESCAFGAECISRECWKENLDCTDACCLGVCVGDTPPPIGRIGDRCRYSVCAEGYCEDSLCVPTKPAGSTCAFDFECDVGLACDLEVCTRLPSTGEACSSGCRNIGEFCNAGRCTRYVPRGGGCTSDSECSSFYHCSNNRTCDVRAIGDDCFGQACGTPLVCDWSTHRCVEPKQDGARCLLQGECASGSCGSSQTCTSAVCI